jgi:hypothetical protein
LSDDIEDRAVAAQDEKEIRLASQIGD